MEEQLVPYQSVRKLGPGPVLVLAPHADDEVLGCAGAIMRHVEAGDAVEVCIVTDGRSGCGSGDESDECAARRRAESRAAALLLGYREPAFWDYPDRGLRYGEKLVQRVGAAIEAAAARLVYAPSIFEVHPDHRALAMATIEAARRRGGDLAIALYEIGVPLRPNRLLDMSDIVDRKRAAIRCFASQLDRQDYLSQIEGLNRFRAYTLGPAVTAAEAYCVVTASELRDDPLRIYESEARRRRQLGVPLDDNEQPLVSIIVRSIGRPMLREALDSLALQTYPRLEVVVVDAIGDGHPPLPDWCGPHPLRLVGLGEALGRSRAANLGLDTAGGTYLGFLDDDDLLDPDHVAGLMEVLTEHPAERVAYAGVRVLDRSAGRQQAAEPRIYHEPFNPQRLVYENYIPIHAVLFHRELLTTGCRFDEGLDVYEDWDFWMQVAEQARFLRVDRCSASYRSAGGSGVGLLHAQPAEVHRQRQALYRKWLGRWTPERIDWLFDEYRQTRHAGVELAHSLRRELERAVEEGRRHLESVVSAYECRLTEQRDAYEAELAEAARAWATGIDELQRELDARSRTLDEVYRSTSWRVMAPLRWLISRVAWRR